MASPSPPLAKAPSQHVTALAAKRNHHPYHLTLIPAVAIGITGMAMLLLVILILLIHRKSRELKGSEIPAGTPWDAFPPLPILKCQEGLSMFLMLFFSINHWTQLY